MKATRQALSISSSRQRVATNTPASHSPTEQGWTTVRHHDNEGGSANDTGRREAPGPRNQTQFTPGNPSRSVTGRGVWHLMDKMQRQHPLIATHKPHKKGEASAQSRLGSRRSWWPGGSHKHTRRTVASALHYRRLVGIGPGKRGDLKPREGGA